ncbi:MFS transporter [bacterium]|nr:MAG: MFS transporter [bacterium]
MDWDSKNKIDRNVFWLGLTSFFNDWSSEMIFPILPAFMAEILGIPKYLIGFIDGVAQSLASILKVFSGYISDKIGKRKMLAVSGYSLSAIVKPFLAIANSWLAVFSVRVGDRIGKGIRTAPRDALIASSAEKDRTGRSFGFHRAMDTLGALFGTLTVFILMKFILGPQSHRTIFLLAVIPALFGIMCIVFGTKEKRQNTQTKKLKFSWRTLPKKLRLLIMATFIFGVGNYTFTFFLLRIREMGIAMALIPLVYLLYNIVYFAVSYPAGIWADKIGKKTVYNIGLVMYIFTALGMAFLNASVWAWILMAIYGLHMGFTNATARALVSDYSPEDIRGTALGMYHTGIGIADLPAGLLAGTLWELFSPKVVFSTGAILTVIALVIIISIRE